MQTLKTLVFFLMGLLLAAPSASLAQEKSKEQMREMIREALKAHPELILEVLKDHQIDLYEMVMQGRELKRKEKWRQQVSSFLKNPMLADLEPGRPVRGNADAKITIVEYTDFLCPSCAEGAFVLKQLLQKYPGKIRIILKHDPSGSLPLTLSQYFEALGRQSNTLAWQFYDRVFADQMAIEKGKLAEVQKIIDSLPGVDKARLARDLADKSINQRIVRDQQEATAFQFQGTPTFLVNGVLVEGVAPLYAFEEIITQWEKRRQSKK